MSGKLAELPKRWAAEWKLNVVRIGFGQAFLWGMILAGKMGDWRGIILGFAGCMAISLTAEWAYYHVLVARTMPKLPEWVAVPTLTVEGSERYGWLVVRYAGKRSVSIAPVWTVPGCDDELAGDVEVKISGTVSRIDVHDGQGMFRGGVIIDRYCTPGEIVSIHVTMQ